MTNNAVVVAEASQSLVTILARFVFPFKFITMALAVIVSGGSECRNHSSIYNI